MKNQNLILIPPRITPVLDPGFRPVVLTNQWLRREADQSGAAVPIRIALEQSDGSVSRYDSVVFTEDHPLSAGNTVYVQRLIKFLLWSRGGFRVHFSGPQPLGDELESHFVETVTGRFDAHIMGDRIYERPFEFIRSDNVPDERSTAAPLGRHMDGCRIGFDLGGSDRKVAAVRDGQVLFSEETVWNPIPETDPQWHFDQIMESLKQAASHLPRVDAIGGSAAGVYVNNQVKVASLFRGVPPDLFASRVKNLFLDLKAAWGGIPFEVVNDGEVTALAGSIALGKNAVLGIAMGTSQAGGYVTPEGNITPWLNELAFVPVDYNPHAPVDEWSGDYGCGVQYFSQQAVGRLIHLAGIQVDDAMPLPEKLKHVQELMAREDYRARKIYETIGVYLGYAVAHYADFYAFDHVLILGRVTTGPGGDVILQQARLVLETEFRDLAARVHFHVPGETEKRHGQAIAAASLPALDPNRSHSNS